MLAMRVVRGGDGPGIQTEALDKAQSYLATLSMTLDCRDLENSAVRSGYDLIIADRKVALKFFRDQRPVPNANYSNAHRGGPLRARHSEHLSGDLRDFHGVVGERWSFRRRKPRRQLAALYRHLTSSDYRVDLKLVNVTLQEHDVGATTRGQGSADPVQSVTLGAVKCRHPDSLHSRDASGDSKTHTVVYTPSPQQIQRRENIRAETDAPSIGASLNDCAQDICEV